MADVYVNALTTISTEPTTTDSIVAVNRNTNEGKIIDYNKLANVILNKLTSKQYSGLNTTSKLLVGAINELDSDISDIDSRYREQAGIRIGSIAGNGTLYLNHSSPVLLYTDRGGLWTEGVNGRFLTEIAESNYIKVTRESTSKLKITNSNPYTAAVVAISEATSSNFSFTDS